jgi:hypothetical protein
VENWDLSGVRSTVGSSERKAGEWGKWEEYREEWWVGSRRYSGLDEK